MRGKAIRDVAGRHQGDAMRYLVPIGVGAILSASFASVPAVQTLVEQQNEIDRQCANLDLSPGAEARIERDIGEALVSYIEEEERKRSAAQ